MNASELLVQALEAEGVEYIFGLPGEENLPFMQALSGASIKFILVRHEQEAGFMAATVGRLTGKPGVCLTTLGPGATNLFTAAAYAQLGGMPMIMLTGQKPLRNRRGEFQILDVVDMMKPVTKHAVQVLSGKSIPGQVRKAVRRASHERPGAVHLEIPRDVLTEEVEAPLYPIQPERRPIAEEVAIGWAVEAIRQAKHPLLLVGAAANRKLTSKMLHEFVDKLGIPFFNTQLGKGVIDERHPKYLGTAALSAQDYLHCAVSRADVIINVGHDSVEKPPFMMEHNGSQKVIHINFYPALTNEVYFPQIEVVGDIANAVWQLKEALAPSPDWDFSYFEQIREEVAHHTHAGADNNSYPIKPQRLVADVRKVMPEDGMVSLDNGMYKLWFTRSYPTYAPNTLLLDNALATMGAGLPSAIATKLLHPDRRVMAIAGDGGFMMNSQAMELAVRLKLDLVVLVLNDGGYGMIKWEQDMEGYKSFGLDFQNPDFIKYAESYGAKGHRIEQTADLAPTMESCFNAGGVHLIDVPVDYSENHKVFTEEIRKISCPV